MKKGITAFVTILFVTIAMTNTTKAASMSAQPIIPNPAYVNLINAQSAALAGQQALTLQAQDALLAQQQNFAFNAQSVGLVQQQQMLMTQAQAAALAEYQLAMQQQYMLAQQTYNDARYLQQQAVYQSAMLNGVQAQQRLNYENMLTSEKNNYRDMINKTFTDEQRKNWFVYTGYYGYQ